MTEFEKWLTRQPRNRKTGKVDGGLLVVESRKRGYCVCAKPFRDMIDFTGCTCAWCMQPETRQSREFYYKEVENNGG